MDPDTIMTIGYQALEVIGILSGMVLLPALVVGLVIAMFQAATQINEMTLSFIPKLLILVVSIMIAGPWMLELIVNYTRRLYLSIPGLIG